MVIAMVITPKSNQNARRLSVPRIAPRRAAAAAQSGQATQRKGWLAACSVQGVNFPVALFIGVRADKL